MYVGNAFDAVSLSEAAASTFGVSLVLASGWTSVVLPFLPRFLGVVLSTFASLFEASASALRSVPDWLAFFSSSAFLASSAFFCSAAFLSASATVAFNFSVAFFNSSTCVLTSFAVALSFLNNSLASAKTLSRSFEILLIFSLSVFLTSVSNLNASSLSSVLSTFAVGNAACGTSTVIGLLSAVACFPESPLAFLSPFAAFPLFWVSCDTGTFSALADIPPPKKIRDATATLAAPKWYFLIEKRVSFSPSLYSYLIMYIWISFIFFYYLIRCCISTSRYLGYSYINNITT